MEPQVERLFTADIKQQAAALAGTTPEKLKALGSFENYVFEYAQNGTPRILRLTHSSHRSLAQVLAELDYVHYLALHGVNVASPLMNASGTWAEALPAIDGSYFVVSLFHKAAGVGKEGFEFDPDILQDWGRITGQMHRLTKAYRLPTDIQPRYQWFDDPHLVNAGHDERLDKGARLRFQETMASIKALPINENTYGLIHTDLHQGNFFVHQQRIIAFDFDDCCYQYFVHDIAVTLYYALWKGYKHMDYQAFTHYYLKHFVAGYEKEHILPADWLGQLPLFLDLRSFLLYAVLTQKLDPATASQKQLDTLEYCRKLSTGEMPLLEFEIGEVV